MFSRNQELGLHEADWANACGLLNAGNIIIYYCQAPLWKCFPRLPNPAFFCLRRL